MTVAVALTACGEDTSTAGGSDPTSTAVSSESGSTSSSPSASGSSTSDAIVIDTGNMLPPVAGHKTRSGAESFAHHYVDVLGRAGESGDTTTLESLGASDCTACDDAVAQIDADHSKGQTLSTNPYAITEVKVTGDPRASVEVTLDVKVKAHERVDSSGKTVESVDAESQTVTAQLEWSDGWEMKAWTVS